MRIGNIELEHRSEVARAQLRRELVNARTRAEQMELGKLAYARQLARLGVLTRSVASSTLDTISSERMPPVHNSRS